MKIYAFTGQMYSGKDYVIEKTGLKNFSLSEPMHALCRHIYGTVDKSKPGIRKALQKIGRLGRGIAVAEENKDEYAKMRRLVIGLQFSPEWDWVEWHLFGAPDFWIRILEARLKRERNLEKCIVSSVRWDDEFAWLSEQDCTFVYIACSERTRRRRMQEAGYASSLVDERDISESLMPMIEFDIYAYHFLKNQNIKNVWNDDAMDSECPKNYLTVDQFLATLQSS